MKGVSVIVPVYNAFEEAEACLHSIAENSNGISQVFVIDDKSPDGRFEQQVSAELIENALSR